MRRLGAQVGVQPEGGAAVVPDSGGLGVRAPAFTAEQLVWLREVMVGAATAGVARQGDPLDIEAAVAGQRDGGH